MITTSRPAIPARTPAASWLPARDGPIVSTVGFANLIGRAPYFSEFESERAWDSVKSPVICAVPSRIGSLTPAEELTFPCRAMATEPGLRLSGAGASTQVVGAGGA